MKEGKREREHLNLAYRKTVRVATEQDVVVWFLNHHF